jgi:hypothetical protein
MTMKRRFEIRRAIVRYVYQIRKLGGSIGEISNANLEATCAEWARSPEGSEVVAVDLATREIAHVYTGDESRKLAHAFHHPKIR